MKPGGGDETKRQLVSHAADRLAEAIVLATRSAADPRTLSAWGQQVGMSRGTVRAWCRAAHLPARSCLDFLRVLRAVTLSNNRRWDLFSLLNVVDERSIARLLKRGGLGHLLDRADAPSVEEFLVAQRFVKSEEVVQAVVRRLHRPNEAAGSD